MRRNQRNNLIFKSLRPNDFGRLQYTKQRSHSIDLRIKGEKLFHTKQKNAKPTTPKSIKWDLKLSDYQAFLLHCNQTKQNNYPQSFKFIKITNKKPLNSFDFHTFNPFGCPRSSLITISTNLIMGNTFSSQKISKKIMEEFITGIARQYNIVGYHNFTHGFALMQMLYRCLQLDSQLKQLYTNEQITFYLISALAHDIGHPGTNNAFEVKRKTQLSQIAGNQSVLQKMHISKLFQIFKEKPQWNFLKFCQNPEKIKKNMIQAILATDIAKHFDNLKTLKKKLRNQDEENGKTSDPQICVNIQDSSFIMGQLFHACDIGNPALDFQQYINWASILTYEFNEQTKLQAKQKVQVSKMFIFTNIINFLEEQNGFITTFVFPLWKQISLKFVKLDTLVKNIQNNLWEVKQMAQDEHV